jgi:hypothetical protein
VLVVRDTAAHVAAETAAYQGPGDTTAATGKPFRAVFTEISWRNVSLRRASQAGLVNNLNDGLTWGAFPLLFAFRGLGLAAIGVIKGVYPLLWGAGQMLTGRLSDTIGRKPLIVAGMLVQAAAFPAALMLPTRPLTAGIVSAVLLGAGTAMVYPALIASVADHTHPSWRAQGLAVHCPGFLAGPGRCKACAHHWPGMSPAVTAGRLSPARLRVPRRGCRCRWRTGSWPRVPGCGW